MEYTRYVYGTEKEDINHVVYRYIKYLEESETMLRKMHKKKEGLYIMNVNKLIQKKNGKCYI